MARGRRRPPPSGARPGFRAGLVLTVAVVAVGVIALRSCPREDDSGRPLWRVATVHDGDTVTCLDERGVARKIRLAGIDAPESGQPHGDAARRALAAKLVGGWVRVEGRARDQHGRLLGTLWIEGRDLNAELVTEGFAWAFGGFVPDEELVAAEAAARRSRRGLWVDERPVPPREWRAAHPRTDGDRVRPGAR